MRYFPTRTAALLSSRRGNIRTTTGGYRARRLRGLLFLAWGEKLSAVCCRQRDRLEEGLPMRVYRTFVVVSLLALVALAGIDVLRRERRRLPAPDCECQLLRGLAADADVGQVYFVRENPRGCGGAVVSPGGWIPDHPFSHDGPPMFTLP